MNNKQSLTEIMNDPHFNQLAALLSIGMSTKFMMAHPEVPHVRATLEYRLIRLVRSYQKDATYIRDDIIKEFSRLIQQIASANPEKYFYRPEDYAWFVEVMQESDIAQITLSSLFAVAVSRRVFYSAEEVESMPDSDGKLKSAETWRQRAQSGKFVGAFKTGKTWNFPDLALRANGVQVPGTPIEIIDESEPISEEE